MSANQRTSNRPDVRLRRITKSEPTGYVEDIFRHWQLSVEVPPKHLIYLIRVKGAIRLKVRNQIILELSVRAGRMDILEYSLRLLRVPIKLNLAILDRVLVSCA